MKITRFINMIAACAVLTAAGAATAQPVITDGEDEQGVPFSEEYYRTLPTDIGVALFRQHTMPTGDFILRLSAMTGFQDCAQRSPLKLTSTTDGPYMDVKVTEMRVDEREKPANPKDCSKATQIPSGDVILSKQMMADQGIKYVRFYYGPLIDNYSVEIKKHSIELQPAPRPGKAKMEANRYQGFNAYGISTPLTLWFYPQDTIILYAPNAPQGEDLEQEITRLAQGRGLLPLSQRIGHYEVAETSPRQYYFVDPQNMYLKELAEQDSAPFAPLLVEKQVYGLSGDQLVREELQVYMKKPGLYE